MSSWSGGGRGQFRVQNELRTDRETIAKGGRRGGAGVGRLKGDGGGGGGYRREGGTGGGGGERGLVEWPELDSTWTTYFYIAREIMGFPS